MLVLSRKVGETIQIGTDITVTVLEIQGSRMKIGISAPTSQRVMRGELVEWQTPAEPRSAERQPLARSIRRAKTTAWVEMPATDGSLAAAR